MDRLLKRLAVTFGVAIFLVQTSSSFANDETVVSSADWKIRMQKMLGEIETLIPFAFEAELGKTTPDSKALISAVKALQANAENLKNHTEKGSVGSADPSFRFIAVSFENELHLAKVGLNSGSTDEARRHMRSAVMKCMYCHTQSATGPSLSLARLQNQFTTLPPAGRILAFAATRQFDSALEAFAKLAKDAKVTKPDTSSFDWSSKAALSIAVRVKKSPASALAVIRQVEESGAGSKILMAKIEGWKKDVEAWNGQETNGPQTDRELYDSALALKTASLPSSNLMDAYRSYDVALLRSAGYLHELLAKYPKSPLRSKGYLELARIYETLPGFALWDLSEEYLAACITENPHSEIAEACYKEYDQNVFLGYSGSSGTNIPSAVKRHIQRMKTLAEPANENAAPAKRKSKNFP